jgi:hypothetical protein
MTAAVARDGEAQRALIAGDAGAARARFAQAADLYQQSWEAAPPTAYGRLVGLLKSAVLAGGGLDAARYAQRALADAEVGSVTAAYALALAALVLGQDEDARAWAARMSAGSEAFARAGATIDALAARDQDRYNVALAAIVRDFEQRAEHLTGVALADTALVLAELGARRGMSAAVESPVLPAVPAP